MITNSLPKVTHISENRSPLKSDMNVSFTVLDTRVVGRNTSLYTGGGKPWSVIMQPGAIPDHRGKIPMFALR